MELPIELHGQIDDYISREYVDYEYTSAVSANLCEYVVPTGKLLLVMDAAVWMRCKVVPSGPVLSYIGFSAWKSHALSIVKNWAVDEELFRTWSGIQPVPAGQAVRWGWGPFGSPVGTFDLHVRCFGVLITPIT